MGNRDLAILSKALCYGFTAFTVLSCAVFHFLGSPIAFEAGVFCGVFCTLVAELLIYIPPKMEDLK